MARPEEPMRHVRLFALGLLMAASIDSSEHHDPDEDFNLWRTSWDALRPAWDDEARELRWRVVGMHWEYHP